MNITEDIKSTFFPEVYEKEVDTHGEIELCLLKKSGIARYCLAVLEFQDGIDIGKQVALARAAIRKSTNSFWLFRELGVYIVFVADKAPKNLVKSELVTDSTGFHAVIVQGLHIIGPNGFHIYNQTKWFGKSFGGADQIASRLTKLKT